MNQCWTSIPKQCKGILLIAIGITFLLYTLGYLKEGVNTIIAITSIGMIGYGILLCDLHTLLKKLLKKDQF